MRNKSLRDIDVITNWLIREDLQSEDLFSVPASGIIQTADICRLVYGTWYIIWKKVFKNGPSKICWRQPQQTISLQIFKGCLPYILLGPLLNTLSHIRLYVMEFLYMFIEFFYEVNYCIFIFYKYWFKHEKGTEYYCVAVNIRLVRMILETSMEKFSFDLYFNKATIKLLWIIGVSPQFVYPGLTQLVRRV